MNILMLSATFPYPPSKGGTQVRTFNLLAYLQRNHAITLAVQVSPQVKPKHIAALQNYVADLKVFEAAPAPSLQAIAKLQRLGQSWRTGIPPNVASRAQPDMQAWLDAQVESGRFDVLTCEHSVNEIFVRPQWRDRLPTVVNIHSSVAATCAQQLQAGTAEHPWRDRLNLSLLQRYERSYCRKFKHLVVTTPEDAQQFQTFAPNTPITVIPNGVDLELFPMRPRDPGGQTLIFAGAMDNQPNIDAAQFLALRILPRLQQRYPQLALRLVGARPVPAVQALAQQAGVTVTGRVDSMVQELHQATVCVIPMRSGFGIKNKTLEALAAGIPVVGSDRALEGLNLDGQMVLRANAIEEYEQAIGQLLDNPSLRQQFSTAGRQFIEQHYTWDVAGQRYEAVLANG
ncbi:MAG: glycosyltransferase [Spirulina sp. SIO3F2]|nr:glycosyltransferase [Spirulina sp. SIO3F2]